MPYSMEDAMSAYGFVYTLANSIPELKTTLDRAIWEKWTEDRLTATIESSTWWQQNSDTVRNLVTQRATDPASFQRSLENAREQITLKAQQMGRTIAPEQLDALVWHTLATNNGWDDQRLSFLIARTTGLTSGDAGSYVGQAAALQEHMTQTAQSYGIAYSKEWLDSWINQVELGANSLDGWDSMLRARAKATYPQFADQIDAGMTVRDIADPYISTYAQTLEVPETDIGLKDSMIQKALSQSGPDGTTRTAMPIWQFQRQLKDDVRYDKTKQAKDDAFAALNKIGKDWGFVGGSGA